MARSMTWNASTVAASCIGWFIVACFMSSLFSQDARPSVFLVSSSLQLPSTTKSVDPRQLSASEIVKLAAARSATSRLVSADSHSRFHSAKSRGQDEERQIQDALQSAISFRLRQNSSANALKLHYGIAACIHAEHLLVETLSLLNVQSSAQIQLVEKGIPIPDPLLIERLKTDLEDKRINNQSKLSVLRTQLSVLIGEENACSHSPIESSTIHPSDSDVCDRILEALDCRCDLVIMKRLRNSIGENTLEVWDTIGALMSGVPAPLKRISFWSKFIRSKCSQAENQRAVAARRAWLEELIAERTRQIAMDVAVAFEKKKSAALRWVKQGEQIANWDTRIAQLEKLSEVHGNLAEQLSSKLNRLQLQGERIERWLDWHQANTDLMLAIGCEQ